jgi:hypothetical protein
MLGTLELLLIWLASLLKSRRRLEAEVLVLRHQLNILRRKAPRRLRLSNADRLAFVWLYRLCPAVADAVTIIRPETLIRLASGRIQGVLALEIAVSRRSTGCPQGNPRSDPGDEPG